MRCIKCNREIPEESVYCMFCGKKQVAEKKHCRKRANGQGTVFKKSGNRTKPWEAQKDGVSVGVFATRAEAQKALDRLTDTEVSDLYNLTFAQVYERWKPEHSRKIGHSGMANYEAAYKNCSSLYGQSFRKLRTGDFQAVVSEMERQGKAKSTCEKAVQLFGQLSKWAIREGAATTNYAPFVTVLAKQKRIRQPFTAEQIKAIETSTHPAAQIAMVLLATGCRPNELFSVPLENCHENYFISGSKTEAGRDRVIPVSAFGLASYQDLLERSREIGGPRLISAYNGNRSHVNFTKRDWRELMAELKIEGMTPYNCRHTYTTMAVQSGVRPELLQKILGHAEYSTTVDVYTHLDLNEIVAAGASVAVTDTLQTQENSQK